MSQHPHDEFDDVPPYQTGEAGKHRAPGAAGTGGAGGSGLRWIALLAGFVLLVGAFAYFIVPTFSDSDADTTAEEQDAAVTEGDDAEDGAAEEGESAEPEEPAEPQPASDTETPVQVANYQGVEGGETAMSAELEELDYNVVWNGSWNFEERAETPAVVYPAGSGAAEQALAEELAASFGVETVEEHDQASFVTLIIGSEYEG